MENVDEEYDYLHDCAKKAESFKTTKRRLSLETLELIRQREEAHATRNQELRSCLAGYCREVIKENLRERSAEQLAEAAEAWKSIRYARRDFASRKTRMTALRNTKGDMSVSPSDEVLLSEIRHAGKKTYGTRSRQNKTRTPEESSASTHQHPGEALYTLPVGMQGLKMSWMKDSHASKQGFKRKGFSTIDHIRTVSKPIEVSREYKMPLCLTFIDLKKAFNSVETEAVAEALDNQGVPTQCIKVLRELYSNFTTGISPFYKNIIIDVKRGVR
ncbi:hypothetical protein RB195_004642 [Necator americanus]|uniref:Reverse transcriptase domain-containing protein n=1 Tax=Necator americanus TaxID=51031 RepID=A0ABR1BMC6_NECAM